MKRFADFNLAEYTMTTKLTPSILRAAAALLVPGGGTYSDHRFMCYAVSEAATAAGLQRSGFRELLEQCGCPTSGKLSLRGEDIDSAPYGVALARAQNLRFDFLNLLACSLD